MYRRVVVTVFLGVLGLLTLSGCKLNSSPQISVFSAFPSYGVAPTRVTFSLSVSDPDIDSGTLTCELDFGDGSQIQSFPCPSKPTVKHGYGAGNYTATLVASDGNGGTSKAIRHINVSIPNYPSDACPRISSSANSLGIDAKRSDNRRGMGEFSSALFVPGELLVYRPGNLKMQSAQDLALEKKLGLERLSTPAVSGWVHYRVPTGSEEELAKQILNSGLGEYVQPNYRYKILDVPNDPLYSNRQKTQYDFMHITQAWNELPASPCRPIVGVIDTGVAYDHPDIEENIYYGYDLSDMDGDPYPSGDSPHGTMVASIFGAETNNNLGMASDSRGIAYIMPLKVFPNATSSTIATAVNWARQHGVHMLNMSFCIQANDGTCADLTDATIEDALRDAYNDGIVSFAASGNYNDNFVGYPASSLYTIAVGATDNDNPPNRADEGDWGAGNGSNYGSRLDVMAPGTEVLGAGIPDNSDPEPYMQGSGTSFASPYAAGVAALYISRYYATENDLPGPDLVRDCMRSTAQDLGPAGVDDETGAGLVRADQMLDTTNSLCYP